MSKKIVEVILFALLCIVFYSGLFYILEIPFIPSISTFIKSNFFIITSISLSLFLFIILRKKIYNKVGYKIFAAILVFVILIKAHFESVYYSSFEEKIIKNFGNNTYLVTTYNSGLIPICDRTFSIVKNHFCFMEKLYSIGCNEYQILSTENDQIKIQLIQKPLMKWHQTSYDTVTIKY